MTTSWLPLAKFPPDVLSRIISSPHVLRLYACGDKILNYKLQNGGGALTLAIVDHWVNPRRAAQWPSRFLSMPTQLTAFAFTSEHDRDYSSLALQFKSLPRTLRSFEFCVYRAGECVEDICWDALFPELQSLTIIDTRPNAVMQYPGSLGAGRLPPHLALFKSTCLVEKNLAWMSPFVRMAKTGAFPSTLTSLQFTYPPISSWYEFDETPLCDAIHALPTSLIHFSIGDKHWPIQAFRASHAIQSLSCTSDSTVSFDWIQHLPRQLHTLKLSFETLMDDAFWTALPPSLRDLTIRPMSSMSHRRTNSHIIIPSLPSALKVFELELQGAQYASGFVWPPALHTLHLISDNNHLDNLPPLPNGLTHLTLNNVNDLCDLLSLDQLCTLQLRFSEFNPTVLNLLPSSLTSLGLVYMEVTPDATMDWSGIGRFSRLQSLMLVGQPFITALANTPTPPLFPPTLSTVTMCQTSGIQISLEKTLLNLPTFLQTLSYIGLMGVPNVLAPVLPRFTNLRRLDMSLDFSYNADDQIHHIQPLPSSKNVANMWRALPRSLEDLSVSVIGNTTIESPLTSMLPPGLKSAVLYKTFMPVCDTPYGLPQLEQLHCKAPALADLNHVTYPRLKKLVDLAANSGLF